MKFKEWFDANLEIGSYPIMNNSLFEAEKYDYCINVSDEFYFTIDFLITQKGCKSFWFPLNECRKDNGVNSIYGAMVILYNAEINNKKVYLHCHAGIHRSHVVRCAYYFLRTGQQLDNNRTSYINQLLGDCARGYLPPKAEFEAFLNYLGSKLPSVKEDLMGGLLDDCKIHTIKNF